MVIVFDLISIRLNMLNFSNLSTCQDIQEPIIKDINFRLSRDEILFIKVWNFVKAHNEGI